MLLDLFRSMKKAYSIAKFRGKWRKRNKHNYTYPNNVFPIDIVKVGKFTYGDLNVYSYRLNRARKN